MRKGLSHHLPDIVRPATSVCYQIEVPNDPWYLRAFTGTFFELASARSWEDDPAHTALDVAQVWLEIALKLFPGCSVPDLAAALTLEDEMSQSIRISPDNPCIIQMWCIDHWEDWYDPSSCIAQGVGQPTSPTGPLEPGQCATYNVSLGANERWLVPVPVSAGFVVEITGVDGAWNDGTFDWFCADGSSYSLGECGSGVASESGDPLPATFHMALIAGLDSSTPQYSNAYNSTIVVPGGLTDVDMWFQANDGTLTDNSGRISFKVKVCGVAISGGSHLFDFTTSDGGWIDRSGHNTTYIAGVGWLGGCDQPGVDTYLQAIIDKVVATASHINRVEVTYTRVYAGFNDGATGAYAAKNFTEGGGGIAIGSDASMATATAAVEVFDANPVDVVPGDVLTVAEVAGYLHARGNCASLAGGSVTIIAVEVFYTGSDPF